MNRSTPRSLRLLRIWLFRTRRQSRRQLGNLEEWKTRAVFWTGAILVGLVVQAFAWTTEAVSLLFDRLRHEVEWAPVVVTPLGLVLISILMRRLSPASLGSGIPQVLLVLKQRYHWLRPAFLTFRVVFAKFVLTCLGLAVGASIGREGPSVHIGAALMHRMGQLGRLRQKSIDNALIVAGGAAGVSAAFNAPLAGIVFAVEELSGSFEQRSSGTLIVTIILSGVVVLALAGHYSYFGHPESNLQFFNAWPAILAVALVGGTTGGIFSRVLIAGSHRVAPWVRHRPYRFALACGLLLVGIGYLTGGTTYGSGYEYARSLLEGEAHGDWLSALGKMAATAVTYFTGIPGGLFSPSLAAGAGLGAAMSPWFPDVSSVGLTVVGMAAFLAGVLQRPITSFVIVLELTGNNHELLLPLMVGAFMAAWAARIWQPAPVYDALGQSLARAWDEPGMPEAVRSARASQGDRKGEKKGEKRNTDG